MLIPKHENCNNCGGCCGPIMATKKEILRIKYFVRQMPKEYKELLKNQVRDNLTCQFRDIDNLKCAIYPIRPRICKMFGLVKGMECKNGNTMELDGVKFMKKEEGYIVPKML